MAITTNNILTLNHEEAMDFFMKFEQDHSFELPEYFTFDEVLKYVREKVRNAPCEECLHDILFNKDGRYGVRPIIIANHFLYF